MPWYSLEYQDNILQDSLNLFGNNHKDMYYAQHVVGLKQYELTDHLGDVLATLSDKRAMNGYQTVGAADSIRSYKPVVVSAYDYYPFGQYMPGRYTKDTNSYCFTTTRTEMVTHVEMVPLHLEAGRMVNAGGDNPVVEPSDNGGIYIRFDRAGAGTETGISWPIDNGGASEPGTPGHIDIEVSTLSGTYTFSVTDDSTGKHLGGVVISGTQGNVSHIVLPYQHTGNTGTLHVSLGNAAQGGDNFIVIPAITVPHYTAVPTSVVSTVCNGESYKYGFNGKLKDNEWAGKGNSLDYGFRIEDPRIARFRSVDPLTKKYPMLTSYQFASNRPIDGIDLDGKEYFNSTTIVTLTGNVAGGSGVGGRAAIIVGNAYDMVGVTRFTAYTALSPLNQDLSDGSSNPQLIVGADISGSLGAQWYHKPTFEQAFNAYSISAPSGFSVKAGLGGGVSIGTGTFGISGGFGIGGLVTTGNQSTLLNSISVTYRENNQVENKLGSNLPLYRVTNQKPIYDDQGSITGWSGSLEASSGGRMGAALWKSQSLNYKIIGDYKEKPPSLWSSTGITVTSDNSSSTKNGKVEGKAAGNWKSDLYKQKETAAQK